MPVCEKVNTCPFFTDKMKSVPAIAEMMKQHYCHKDFARCARYRVFRAGLPVPGNLYPNEDDRAAQIIEHPGQ